MGASWILGELSDPRAVGALITLVEKTRDVYIARAAVRALGKIGTIEALYVMKSLSDHPGRMLGEESPTAKVL
jgi:HEAT repeat protein